MVASTFPAEPTNRVVDQAAQSADQAIRSTQRVTEHALDNLASGARDLRQEAAPVLNRAAEQASALAHRGLDAIRQGSHRLTEKAQHASDNTVNYIKDEPIKAVLIAAATGAALLAVIWIVSRSRHGA